MRPASVAVLLALSTLAPVTAGARTRTVHSPRPIPVAAYAEGGYANAASVAQGGLLEFHIATAVSPFPLQIFAVPASWPSGYYAARFPTSLGMRNIFFLVREDHPGSTSPMAVVVATNTFQAYNTYGYKSVYPSNSPERSYRVSFDRPYQDDRGLGRFNRWDKPFLTWMTSENRSFEVISDSDLEEPEVLDHYHVAVIVGHSEYWTATARAHLERFVDNGGRVAILSGNTMWWQARVENRALVVYKEAAPDPENGRNDSIVTVNWFAEPVLRPENLITGASFRNGGYTNLEAPQYGYTVADASHWIFDRTGVSNGTQFGNVAAGDETDGALYNCTMNGLEVDGSDGTPLNFRILATVPAAEGHGTVGIYTTPTGGAVFNAGTQDWVLGLATDPIVRLMTGNVLDRFRQGRLPYEPVTSNVRMRELFNCALDTTEEKIVPGWRGEEGGLMLSARCAAEGAAGLELTGAQRILIRRGFAPTGNTTSRAEANFSVNADASSGSASAQLSLVTLQGRRGAVVSRAARVEFQPSTKSVRLVLFNANNGATLLRTDWVPLTSGWNTVQMAWQSPGAATLRVNGGAANTVVNPLADQSVGEVLISYDEPSMSGSLCVDALSVQ
jgi:hypothetical protein